MNCETYLAAASSSGFFTAGLLFLLAFLAGWFCWFSIRFIPMKEKWDHEKDERVEVREYDHPAVMIPFFSAVAVVGLTIGITFALLQGAYPEANSSDAETYCDPYIPVMENVGQAVADKLK